MGGISPKNSAKNSKASSVTGDVNDDDENNQNNYRQPDDDEDIGVKLERESSVNRQSLNATGMKWEQYNLFESQYDLKLNEFNTSYQSVDWDSPFVWSGKSDQWMDKVLR